MSEGTVEQVLAGEAQWCVLHGDSVAEARSFSAASIDAIVCDPPYHLTSAAGGARGFMGRAWDGGDVALRPETWAAYLDACKPGAHLLAFGGTRTAHRIACAIEDAGWEIRDSVISFGCAWIYGSGFPKSKNLGNGIGTALKPAWEPIILARKPFKGTTEACFAEHGTGGMNIDSCRVESAGDYEDKCAASVGNRAHRVHTTFDGGMTAARDDSFSPDGRWPPNAVFTHTPLCRLLGTAEAAANPTWDTPNRDTEPSAFTGSEVSRVRHANGRNGEASAEKRYADQGSTSFAPLPGARRDDTETVDRWECVSAGSATVPSFSFRTRASEPANAHDTLDLLRLALACMLSSGTGDKDHGPGASELCRTSRTFEAAPASLDAAAHALGLTALPGFLVDCPSCRGSGDEHVRRLVADARGGPARLAGALALVIRLVESHEHSRTRPPSDLQSSSGGSLLANGEPDTSSNRSDGASPASVSNGSASHTARRVRKERAQSGPPPGTHESSTCAHDGSRASAFHSGHNADCIRTLATLALELAWLFVSQLEREDSTISWSSCPVRELAMQSGDETGDHGGKGLHGRLGPAHGTTHGNREPIYSERPASSGSASRFFPQFEYSELDDITPFLYLAKAARSERDRGLDQFRPRTAAEATDSEDGQARLDSPRTGAGRTGGARNCHPTVKPVELLRWLIRLATPPGGIVLDPFAGSGSCGIAALLEGRRYIGIELNDTDAEPFVSIARARLHHVEGREFVPRESLRASEPPKQVALFQARGSP